MHLRGREKRFANFVKLQQAEKLSRARKKYLATTFFLGSVLLIEMLSAVLALTLSHLFFDVLACRAPKPKLLLCSAMVAAAAENFFIARNEWSVLL